MRIAAILPSSMTNLEVNSVLEAMTLDDGIRAASSRHPNAITIIALEEDLDKVRLSLAKYVKTFEKENKAFIPNWRFIAHVYALEEKAKDRSWARVFMVGSESIAEALCLQLGEIFGCQALWCPEGESFTHCHIYIREFSLYQSKVLKYVNQLNIKVRASNQLDEE